MLGTDLYISISLLAEAIINFITQNIVCNLTFHFILSTQLQMGEGSRGVKGGAKLQW